MRLQGSGSPRGGFGTVVVEPTPEGVDPYMVDGVNRAPGLVPRICGTPERRSGAGGPFQVGLHTLRTGVAPSIECG